MTPTPPDDLLARAEAALRAAPVPEGPSDETIARTLAALRAAEANTQLSRRRRIMRLTWKVAAAVLVVAGGLAWFAGARPMAPLAFAEVAEKLRAAHTLSCRMALQIPGAKEPVTARVLFKDPGLTRVESPRGPVTVTDRTQGKALVLTPATKSAVLLGGHVPGWQKSEAGDVATQQIEHLRQLAGEKGEPAGTKRIGGVEARGFRVKERGQDLTVWADPKSRLPVEVEVTVRVRDQDTRMTFSDFELDPKLDDALFRLEPPEGYKLQKLDIPEAKVEDDVARLLRAYAESSGGSFPPRLDDWAAYDKQFQGKKVADTSDPEGVRMVQTVVRVSLFLLHHKDEYGYKADGVKLGDADKIVFWYKPKDAAKYRALFGDLHAADVEAGQLPK